MKSGAVKLILFFLLFSGTLAANIFLVIDKRDKSRDAAQIFLENNQQNKNEDKILSLEKLLRSIESEQKELDTYFVKKADVISFLKRIESLAASVRVDLDMSSVNDKEKNTLILEFRTQGTFEDTFTFLGLLESLPYRTDLERVYLTKEAKDEDVWNGTFSFWLLSYITS